MSTLRLFTGIPLPDCIADPLLDATERLRNTDRSWHDEKWVPRANLHVTLHFLGSLNEAEMPALLEALDEAVEFSSFVLPLDRVSAVPGLRRCRMLWASFLDPEGACEALAESIQRAALPFGIPAEERAFRPHATLCRARRPKPLEPRALEEANALLTDGERSVSVGRATLFTSRLSPRGPVYTALRDWHARGE